MCTAVFLLRLNNIICIINIPFPFPRAHHIHCATMSDTIYDSPRRRTTVGRVREKSLSVTPAAREGGALLGIIEVVSRPPPPPPPSTPVNPRQPPTHTRTLDHPGGPISRQDVFTCDEYFCIHALHTHYTHLPRPRIYIGSLPHR